MRGEPLTVLVLLLNVVVRTEARSCSRQFSLWGKPRGPPGSDPEPEAVEPVTGPGNRSLLPSSVCEKQNPHIEPTSACMNTPGLKYASDIMIRKHRGSLWESLPFYAVPRQTEIVSFQGILVNSGP